MRKFLFITSCLITAILWLGITQSGLTTIVKVINTVSQGKVVIAKATGSIIRGVMLYNVRYRNNIASINIASLALTVQSINTIKTTHHILTFYGNNIEIEPKFALYILKDLNTTSNVIDNITGEIFYNLQTVDINLKNLSGTWQGYPLAGNMQLSYLNNACIINSANISIDNNLLQISNLSDKIINWQLKLPMPEKIVPALHGSLLANGQIILNDVPIIKGDVVINALSFADININNVVTNFQLPLDSNMPLHITSTANKVQYNKYSLDNINIHATGTVNATQLTINLLNASTHASLQLDNKIIDHALDCTINQFTISSAAWGDLHLKTPSILKLDSGKIILKQFALTADNFDSTLELTGKLDTDTNQVNANIAINTANIAWLMQWFPDITRLKGRLASHTTITGSIYNPEVATNTDITNISMTFPAYGIKIKPLELHINSKNQERLLITGTGKMRRGPGEFQISGYIEPTKPKLPNEIHLVGKDVEFIKTASYHLIADPNLTINFKNFKTMQLAGTLHISRGEIDLDKKNLLEIHRSKDIIIADKKPSDINDEFSIIPDLYVRIANKVKLKGLGLNSVISGKLKVTIAEQLFRGEGRISTKKGYYDLKGQKLYVHYGRLFYPTGTLLNDPYLDIKISKHKPIRVTKQQATGYNDHKSCLYIQGTLNDPVLEDNGLIEKDQALAQILNFGSGSLITSLQNKFNLAEFSIANNESNYDQIAQQSKNDSLLDNKNLIIGKKLSKKVYLQYSKGLMDSTQNTVRLKYLLSGSWSVGVETGTFGNGADLNFALDKD